MKTNIQVFRYIQKISQTIKDSQPSARLSCLSKLKEKITIVRIECDKIIKMEEDHNTILQSIRDKYYNIQDIDKIILSLGNNYELMHYILDRMYYIPHKNFILKDITDPWDIESTIRSYRDHIIIWVVD